MGISKAVKYFTAITLLGSLCLAWNFWQDQNELISENERNQKQWESGVEVLREQIPKYLADFTEEHALPPQLFANHITNTQKGTLNFGKDVFKIQRKADYKIVREDTLALPDWYRKIKYLKLSSGREIFSRDTCFERFGIRSDDQKNYANLRDDDLVITSLFNTIHSVGDSLAGYALLDTVIKPLYKDSIWIMVGGRVPPEADREFQIKVPEFKNPTIVTLDLRKDYLHYEFGAGNVSWKNLSWAKPNVLKPKTTPGKVIIELPERLQTPGIWVVDKVAEPMKNLYDEDHVIYASIESKDAFIREYLSLKNDLLDLVKNSPEDLAAVPFFTWLNSKWSSILFYLVVGMVVSLIFMVLDKDASSVDQPVSVSRLPFLHFLMLLQMMLKSVKEQKTVQVAIDRNQPVDLEEIHLLNLITEKFGLAERTNRDNEDTEDKKVENEVLHFFSGLALECDHQTIKVSKNEQTDDPPVDSVAVKKSLIDRLKGFLKKSRSNRNESMAKPVRDVLALEFVESLNQAENSKAGTVTEVIRQYREKGILLSGIKITPKDYGDFHGGLRSTADLIEALKKMDILNKDDVHLVENKLTFWDELNLSHTTPDDLLKKYRKLKVWQLDEPVTLGDHWEKFKADDKHIQAPEKFFSSIAYKLASNPLTAVSDRINGLKSLVEVNGLESRLQKLRDLDLLPKDQVITPKEIWQSTSALKDNTSQRVTEFIHQIGIEEFEESQASILQKASFTETLAAGEQEADEVVSEFREKGVLPGSEHLRITVADLWQQFEKYDEWLEYLKTKLDDRYRTQSGKLEKSARSWYKFKSAISGLNDEFEELGDSGMRRIGPKKHIRLINKITPFLPKGFKEIYFRNNPIEAVCASTIAAYCFRKQIPYDKYLSPDEIKKLEGAISIYDQFHSYEKIGKNIALFLKGFESKLQTGIDGGFFRLAVYSASQVDTRSGHIKNTELGA